MDYEKKYKEVLERAKGHYGVAVHYGKEEEIQELEHIFPELKESEDERVRKHLVKHFQNKTKEDWNGMPVKDILAWLEKQRSQNLANSEKTCKDETKFKVGDKIINPINEIWVVEGIDNEYCQVTRVKDGFHCYFKLQDKYQWKLAGQESAWSEEDEKMLVSFLHKLEVCTLLSNKEYRWANKKLKYIERDTWKPSDEQMSQLECVAIQNKDNMLGKELMTLFNDLKKLTE